MGAQLRHLSGQVRSPCNGDREAPATPSKGAKALMEEHSKKPPPDGPERSLEAKVWMKWVSLISLTAQTSAQVFVIKWARAGTRASGGPVYLPSAVVLLTEVVKTCASFLLVAMETGGLLRASAAVAQHFARDRAEALKISVPSLLYTVQNNLMFFSLGKLSAAVQQVTYQLKILTTAILSVLILGKALTAVKWMSLLLLLVGVLLVQWPRAAFGSGSGAEANGAGPAHTFLGLGTQIDQDALMGFSAVLAACFTSGFASVYLEKLLKQTEASIWMRNVQLGLIGSVMATFVALFNDGDTILQDGFMQGFSPRVYCVVLTNALGGLLCAAVLKYADNILRCFSTALSIVLTCVLSSTVLQEYVPDALFLVGATAAICATFLYSLGPPQSVSWMCEAALRRLGYLALPRLKRTTSKGSSTGSMSEDDH